MPNHVSITGNRTSTYELDESDTVITVKAGGSISAVLDDDSPYGIRDVFDNLQNTVVNVDGRIYASDNSGAKFLPIGVYISSPGSRIEVGASGSIMADRCIDAAGKDSVVVNSGSLTGLNQLSEGIAAFGDGARILNAGNVTAYQGIETLGEHAQFVNGKHGVVTGYHIAIDAAISNHSIYINHGLVEALGAGSMAFHADQTGATLKIVNNGRIIGAVDLGDGKDTVDTRGGEIRGAILGGLGDDTLITDNAKYRLTEAALAGTDTVKSTVSYTLSDNVENLVLLGKKDANGTGNSSANTIEGNAGDNKLVGGDGVDTLHGGRGNDTLSGGLERDTFVFSTGDGHDIIADFETIDEHIDVSGWKAVHSFNQLQNHMTNENGGVMITFGQDSLFVDNLHKADLQDRHFII